MNTYELIIAGAATGFIVVTAAINLSSYLRYRKNRRQWRARAKY